MSTKCELCNVTYKNLSRHLRSKKHIQAEKGSHPEIDIDLTNGVSGLTEPEQELMDDMKRATERIGFGFETSEECPLCSKINSWDENRLLIEVLNNKLDQVIRNQGILLESILRKTT